MTEFMDRGSSAEETLLTRQTLCDQIYERLKSDIVHQKIAFGERLVNRELQKKFGVSSTPVRDAINHLYQDGLVETITNTGARVTTLTLPFLLDSNMLLSILTQGAVELIGQAGRLEELTNRLEKLVLRQRSIRTADDYVQADKEFHHAFFECCGNRQLLLSFERYELWTEILVRLAAKGRNDYLERIEQHEQILEACRQGDMDTLRQQLSLHYSESAKWFAANADILGLEDARD